ncbi:MAG: hypothetical protein M0P99_03685 [Candidatus Cloacimonetes bacterium]|nr:hypothetical protein [Candidatus Cloacimonadota bacterium]
MSLTSGILIDIAQFEGQLNLKSYHTQPFSRFVGYGCGLSGSYTGVPVSSQARSVGVLADSEKLLSCAASVFYRLAK